MAEGAAVELSGLTPQVSDELLTLYFENRRRSGGGPVQGWQRLGSGGVLTFLEGADATRVLAREHCLCGVQLSLRPAPPWCPSRLLLLGLPPGTTLPCLEQYMQALLRASGLPGPCSPCQALDSPCPDRALVQLPWPLSEADFRVLEEQACALSFKGARVSLARVPQARAVRVVGATLPVDRALLELYLESERRSGGGALEGLCSLPGHGGIVATFQQWQVAEQVLQREHHLQGEELLLVPHYDVLEPELLSRCPAEDSNQRAVGPGLTGTTEGTGTVSLGPKEGSETPRAAEPLDQERPVGIPLSSGACLESPAQRQGPSSRAAECFEQVGQVEKQLSMEPGALRFLQLHYGDLLAGLGDVGLVPCEGPKFSGFQIYGAPGPCQAAEEFLQSLLGSVSCHTLSLGHPGSANFLLSPDGQNLLQDLEARFLCVFGTEHLTMATLGIESTEVDPTETLSHTAWPPEDTGGNQEDLSVEEVQELLATLGNQSGEDCLPSGLGDKPIREEELEPPETLEGEPEPLGTEAGLKEAAALQLALHRSLAAPAQEDSRALQQALALSLLDSPMLEEHVLRTEGLGGSAQLRVHMSFEQDVDTLHQALEATLETHLWEEKVGPWAEPPSTELQERLGQCHGVTVAQRGDCIILRGFGEQPARAARHLAALLAGPHSQCLPATAAVTSNPTCPEPELQWKMPLGRLEPVADSSDEFQRVVQPFLDTLDAAHNKIRVVRVERVTQPLLQHQYELHMAQLEQSCERRPLEHVLYHGTTARAIRDICEQGFNRSFCGRNGTLYGQGVYFARRASLSVQDRYSPPDAQGYKAVFVARVLTGDYAQGHKGLRVPPLRDPTGDMPLRYDSTVDCLAQPSIFVIFHDTQALPTYLITCQHMPEGPARAT